MNEVLQLSRFLRIIFFVSLFVTILWLFKEITKINFSLFVPGILWFFFGISFSIWLWHILKILKKQTFTWLTPLFAFFPWVLLLCFSRTLYVLFLCVVLFCFFELRKIMDIVLAENGFYVQRHRKYFLVSLIVVEIFYSLCFFLGLFQNFNYWQIISYLLPFVYIFLFFKKYINDAIRLLSTAPLPETKESH